jgi:hypothetical protein
MFRWAYTRWLVSNDVKPFFGKDGEADETRSLSHLTEKAQLVRAPVRQMTAVKEGQVAIARELYAEAYEPVRVERTLEALERQRGLISAAEGLEKRALAIHDWPVDQATWAWVIGIATSVFALTLGRLILKPLGI